MTNFLLTSLASITIISSAEQEYAQRVRPLLSRYCFQCHAGDTLEADIDLAAFEDVGQIRRQLRVWQKIYEMLDSAQMPPKDADQPTELQREQLRKWVHDFLAAEALARAGDPGRVVLRRLSNAEYTYTLRDVTRIDSLDPTREFPVDGAAGEGFTNAGDALVMSPALVTKFLKAAKEVAGHAVLLPDGIRFSRHTTRRDWTDEWLKSIREFYDEFSDPHGGSAVNLQGIQFDTNQGGRLPLDRYLHATLTQRDALVTGTKTPYQVAPDHQLNGKYLSILWQALADEKDAIESGLLHQLRTDWQSSNEDDLASLVTQVTAWQKNLWKFNSIGHIGREGGPRSWMEAVNPITTQRELKLKLPAAATSSDDITLYLIAGDAGDGNDGDVVIWTRPKLVLEGMPELLLRNVRSVVDQLANRHRQIFNDTAKCLHAADEALASADPIELVSLSSKHDVDSDSLSAWLDCLGILSSGPARMGDLISQKSEGAAGYAFIHSWVGEDSLGVHANSSDQHVRIPGNVAPHSVAVHPAPTRSVGIGWRSPVNATVAVGGSVQHAHPECGNGVAWSLELRQGSLREQLAAGNSDRSNVIVIDTIDSIRVRVGSVISLVVKPKEGNHACDLTQVNLIIQNADAQWNLATDVSHDIHSGNPHADSYGNADVWHFFSEPSEGATSRVIPADSLLSQWKAAGSAEQKQQLAAELQSLLTSGVENLNKGAPDTELYRKLTALGGPLLSSTFRSLLESTTEVNGNAESKYGLDPDQFGRNTIGQRVDPANLHVKTPSVVEVRLPRELFAGAEFHTTGVLDPMYGKEGSVQLSIATEKPEQLGLSPDSQIVVAEDSLVRPRIEKELDTFRQLFPAALCYRKIVPVDEVVTLTLFYREDEHLKRLILDDQQTARLDRLWDELLFISQEPLGKVAAFEQISEFATQDRPDLVKAFKPLREPTLRRAESFRRRMIDTEPTHVTAALDIVNHAWRRALTEAEQSKLQEFYKQLRESEMPHDEAIRLLLARAWTSPTFLYRQERPAAGDSPVRLTDLELASRLSYFLWSSLPDRELRLAATSGRLTGDPAELQRQTRRMLRDGRTRRFAVEFVCQWLHIRGFDQFDDKNEALYPEFSQLRADMNEESVRFFENMIQQNESILDLFQANYTFLNEAMAKHYGIPGVYGTHWRRVEGVQPYGRGGVLGMATTLASQSGASRTSPILRGNWVSETLLGERLPRPPANVPQLPPTVPSGLTARQLIERHSSAPECAKCHTKIDPYGFALEKFDTIGRNRTETVDVRTTITDGTSVEGLEGLRNYLVNDRNDDIMRQFCRKLLGYALGREVQLSDEPLLSEMKHRLAAGGYRFGTAVEAIVTSQQFCKTRGRDSLRED